jgi:hypothetical protein
VRLGERIGPADDHARRLRDIRAACRTISTLWLPFIRDLRSCANERVRQLMGWMAPYGIGSHPMGNITTIGLDLAKNVFQVHAVDEAGSVVMRKRLRRGRVLAFFAGIPSCLVGLESLRDDASLGARVNCAWP